MTATKKRLNSAHPFWISLNSLLILSLLLLLMTTVTANAQSNVRPPSNAVNTGTGPELEGGNVPGGTMGVSSDADLWRNIRKGITGKVSIQDKKAANLVQSEGENWRALRNGPLATYGAWALGGMLGLLVLFFLVRGRIKIDSGVSGRTITRFDNIERMGHWILAVSFIVLALTGLNVTYGKYFLLPLIGKEAFASLAITGKWLHNYMAFGFMLGLVWVLITWIKHNFPSKYDLMWMLKGGGILTKSHPPAKKFNAGQKILFWLIILGGISISLSGISLLLPYEMPLFAKTFTLLNSWFGTTWPTELTAIQEMQYASTWHAIVALFLMCVVIGHIYIGTIGMQGAFDAMGSGEVDANWAKEHHSVWYEEETKKSKDGSFMPAE